jgi:crossover junction endodeoxyribonuclease RuvC
LKILGIDPGSLKTGYALIEINGKSTSILTSGFVDLRAEKDFFRRLSLLHTFFFEFVKSYGTSYEVSVESLIHVKNVNSLAKLAQARGAILSLLLNQGCDVYEYAPNLIKSAVSGHGHASKDSLAKALGFLFPQHSFSSDDESDALALALCHSLYRGRPKGVKVGAQKKGNLKSALKHLEK